MVSGRAPGVESGKRRINAISSVPRGKIRGIKKTPTANAMRVFLCLVILLSDHMDARALVELAPVLVIPVS